jgi:L-iditol 2-dehydrogenase
MVQSILLIAENSSMAVLSATTMKAVIYAAPGDYRVEDRPLPGAPGPGELLVRVRACGVCGSDVTDWYMSPRAPVTLGHEAAGDIVAVGAGVTTFAEGDRVALHHHMPCMVCDVCQHGHYTLCPQFKGTRLHPGGLAEYARVPAEIVAGDVLKIPEDMPYEVGALVEPIACCVRALDRSNIHQSDTVLVMGAGFNGIVLALLASHWGADRVGILDRVPVRLDRARKLGITPFNVDDTEYVDQVRAWANGRGPHSVLVTPATTRVIDAGFSLAGPGATVMMYGPPAPDDIWALNANRVFFQEITITGSYSAGPYDTRRALSLLRNRVIDPGVLITHRFPIEQAKTALSMIKQAGDSLKIMVEI